MAMTMADSTAGSAVEMPVTPPRNTPPRTKSIVWWLFMLMPLTVMITSRAATVATAATAATTTVPAHAADDLHGLLRTEAVLIDALRHYIETLEGRVAAIKSETLKIRAINDVARNDTLKYLGNPINAVTILKRFASDWVALRQYAADDARTQELVANIAKLTASEHLQFPSEADYDEAVGNLLRIQEAYRLEPRRLAGGIVNGIKMGSAMSWSDCLEIGRRSDKNGDYTIAKFWMEAALGKLPAEAAASNGTRGAPQRGGGGGDSEGARFEIYLALLNTEYRMGNIDAALDIVAELRRLRPKHKGVLKAQAMLQRAAPNDATDEAPSIGKTHKIEASRQRKKKNSKSAEELLIEEICRDAAASRSRISSGACSLERGNLPQLTLQPLHVEVLSGDPYIAIHHNVLDAHQIDALKALLDEDSSGSSATGDGVVDLQFSMIGRKKLTRVADKLQLMTGHGSAQFVDWRAQRIGHEAGIARSAPSMRMQLRRNKTVANVLFNLQRARLGGAIVYPQLELSVDVPERAVLYWSGLNEFHEEDYRSKQYVCPIIAGSQITAFGSIMQT